MEKRGFVIFFARIHIEYFHLGIFVTLGVCLIKKYGSQITAFFFCKMTLLGVPCLQGAFLKSSSTNIFLKQGNDKKVPFCVVLRKWLTKSTSNSYVTCQSYYESVYIFIFGGKQRKSHITFLLFPKSYPEKSFGYMVHTFNILTQSAALNVVLRYLYSTKHSG